MVRFTKVFFGDIDEFEQLKPREVPVSIEDNYLSMVMAMDPEFILVDCFKEPTKNEVKEFDKKFQRITFNVLQTSLKVTSNEFFNMFNQLVSCLSCRRGTEQLFDQAIGYDFPAFYPVRLDSEGNLSLPPKRLNPKFLCTIFSSPRGRVQTIIDTLSKIKAGRRCPLHSCDSQRLRPVTSLLEVWDAMDLKCQKETVLIDSTQLAETMERYFIARHFCLGCKSTVLKAFQMLLEKSDGSEDPSYDPGVFDGIVPARDAMGLRVPRDKKSLVKLITKAVPEILVRACGHHESRHADTMQVAQEEVLTCIGIFVFERLNKLFLRFKEEAQIWEIFMVVAIRAFHCRFEFLLEKELGVSQLELFCEELSKEEQKKQQKLNSKKQRRRRKKDKKTDDVDTDEKYNNPDPVDFSGVNHDPVDFSVPDADGDALEQNELCHQDEQCDFITSTSSAPVSYCTEETKSTLDAFNDVSSENFAYDMLRQYIPASISSTVKSRYHDKSRPGVTSSLPLPYRSLEEQLEDSCSIDEEEPCIPSDEITIVQSRLWEEMRAVFRQLLLNKFKKLPGTNIPPPNLSTHFPECSHSDCKSVYDCESRGESYPSNLAFSSGGCKTKTQSCRPAGSTNGRVGSGSQGRRYKGKNRH